MTLATAELLRTFLGSAFPVIRINLVQTNTPPPIAQTRATINDDMFISNQNASLLAISDSVL